MRAFTSASNMVKKLCSISEGFIPLSPSVHVKSILAGGESRQQPIAPTTDTGHPDLIVVTSWTGALPKHIAKYTNSYSQLYPNCPILLVTTSIKDLTLQPSEKKSQALMPAVHYIHAQILSRQTQQYNILLHAFSEGGSSKAVWLAQEFLDHTGYQLPVAAYVYDSTPGTARFSNNLAAFKRSLPLNPFVRFCGICFGTFFLAISYFFHFVLARARDDLFTKTRKALNDAKLWPVAGVPRTYLFSEADDLICWKDVVDHAEYSARHFNVLSLVVKFKATAHCNHMKENEDYYWSAVKKTWDSRKSKYHEPQRGIQIFGRHNHWRSPDELDHYYNGIVC
jgi:hypothetical protein